MINSKRYQHLTLGDKTIVQDVSFQILQGKILMLLGENGCGKTTSIKGLLQEYPLAKGSVTFNGSNVQTLSYKTAGCCLLLHSADQGNGRSS